MAASCLIAESDSGFVLIRDLYRLNASLANTFGCLNRLKHLPVDEADEFIVQPQKSKCCEKRVTVEPWQAV